MVKKGGTSLFRWWRGLLGIVLTCFIAIPYVMGLDVEKYLRHWVEAANQKKDSLQFELQHYQRHWFSSEGDLVLTHLPLNKKLVLHFTAYHGPFLPQAEPGHHWGLGYVRGQFNSRELVGEQNLIQMTGPILLNAFIPYFSDRELQGRLPAVTIMDKGNNLVYRMPQISASLDDDGLLQLQIPKLSINRPDGSEKLTLNTALLRIQSDGWLFSFSAKEILLPLKDKGNLTLYNFLLTAHTPDQPTPTDELALAVNAHFDQLKTQALDAGPFDFTLNLSGLQLNGLNSLAQVLKTLNPQNKDLSLEQEEALEKTVAQIFAANTLFDLHGDLLTTQGHIKAQFQGGFNAKQVKTAWKNTSELVDAFYSHGSIQLTAGIKEALSIYTAQLTTQPTLDSETLTLPLLVQFLKPTDQGYVAHIDIQEGVIRLNGKKSKS